MNSSKRMIGVLGAVLLAVPAASGCSRGRADQTKAEAEAPAASAPMASGTAVAQSEVPGLTLAAVSDLPRSPETGVVDEYCEGYRAETLTATGRLVEAKAWIVTSEAALGRYRVVSFVSGFEPGTSALCFGRNGNVAAFDGTRLVGLAYAARGSKTQPGRLERMDNGALLVWGDSPGTPLGELHLEQDQLRLTAVAAERAFCRGGAVVPNVYGKPIEAARTELIGRGWRPLPPPKSEWEHSGAERLKTWGVIEAEACSGTGMGYCAFKYQGASGVLSVTTAGDGDEVVSYGVACSGAEGTTPG